MFDIEQLIALLEQRLEVVNERHFMLKMKDHWSNEDYYIARGMELEAKTIEQELEYLKEDLKHDS